MISINEINSRAQLCQTRQRWNRLVSQCRCYTPFLSFEWYQSALETINKDKIPLLLFFKANGKDVALAPLVYKKSSFLGNAYYVISFVHNSYTQYQGFIYQDGFENIMSSLLGYLRQRFGTLFYLDLDEIRLTDEENEAIQNLASKGLILFDKEEKSGSMYLKLNSNFEQILHTLKKKTQKEFKRKLKRLSELGSVDIVRIQGEDRIETHLDRYFEFQALTWKGKEPFPEFYYELCKKFNNLDKLYFYGLTLNGQPIAYLTCLYSNNSMHGIKTTYTPSYSAFSPGIILFYRAIENMSRIPGIAEFDFGRGNEQFKREWTSLSHKQVKLFIYPNTFSCKIFKSIRLDFLPLMKKPKILKRIYFKLKYGIHQK